jgi:hypothetical protein
LGFHCHSILVDISSFSTHKSENYTLTRSALFITSPV